MGSPKLSELINEKQYKVENQNKQAKQIKNKESNKKTSWEKIVKIGKILTFTFIMLPIFIIIVPIIRGDTLLISTLSPELKAKITEAEMSSNIYEEIKNKETSYDDFVQQRTFEGFRNLSDRGLQPAVSLTTLIYNDLTFFSIIEMIGLDKFISYIKCNVYFYNNELYCNINLNKVNSGVKETISNIHSNSIQQFCKTIADKIIEKKSPYHYFFYEVVNRNFSKAIEFSNELLRVTQISRVPIDSNFLLNQFYANLMTSYSHAMLFATNNNKNLLLNSTSDKAISFLRMAEKILNEQGKKKNNTKYREFTKTEAINYEFYAGYVYLKTGRYDLAIVHFKNVLIMSKPLCVKGNENHVNFMALLYNDIAFCEYSLAYYSENQIEKSVYKQHFDNAELAIEQSQAYMKKLVNCQNCISQVKMLKSIDNNYNTILSTIAEIAYARYAKENADSSYLDKTRLYLRRSIDFGFSMDSTTLTEYEIYRDIFQDFKNRDWGIKFIKEFFPKDTILYNNLYN